MHPSGGEPRGPRWVGGLPAAASCRNCDGIPAILSLPTIGAPWALQKQPTADVAVFYQGFSNGAEIPHFPSDLVSGVGIRWNLGRRLAVYTSYNRALDDAGSPSGGSSGFADAC